MLSQKFSLVIVLFLVPLGLLAYFALTNSDWNLWGGKRELSKGQAILRVKDFPVRVDVVVTPADQRRGLSGRELLEADEGMLFWGEKPELRGIWMKDMLFSIDILWLNEQGVIVDIYRNAVPESYPEVFYPRIPAVHVLELPAHFTELHSVSVGDTVIFPTNF